MKASRGELVRVDHYYVGEGPERLKVGIAEDGTLLFVLPPRSGNEEVVIALERDNAIQILEHFVSLLREQPSDSRKRKRS